MARAKPARLSDVRRSHNVASSVGFLELVQNISFQGNVVSSETVCDFFFSFIQDAFALVKIFK